MLWRITAMKTLTFRIMMQPMAMSGVVAKPHSSAPNKHEIATSLPVLSWPSVCTMTLPRRSFRTSVWCVSARPSSHGRPAYLMPVHLDAPVPPSWPEMRIWSALALATPDATIPTPVSDTSLTDTLARGFEHLRS
jgi:hypothetical protein